MMSQRRGLLAALSFLMVSASAFGQSSSVYSNASAPKREDLAKLNLRSAWTAYIPMDGRQDALGPVQAVDTNQIFVQTRMGRLIALDENTGAQLWSFRYPKSNANLYPVGVTDKFVFAVNVNTLYCFHRYSGVLEFRFDLPGLSLPGAGGPTAGPVADDENVYLQLGSNRIVAYRYPAGIKEAESEGPLMGPGGMPLPQGPGSRSKSMARQVAERYGRTTNIQIQADEEGFQRTTPYRDRTYSGSGLGGLQKTPSLASMARITPPYDMHREIQTPSMNVVTSLRPPYHLNPPYLAYNQITPSVAVLPPSAAAAQMLSNLRPVSIEPKPLWAASAPGRVVGEPITNNVPRNSEAPPQLWFTTSGPMIFAVDKINGTIGNRVRLSAAPAAPAAGPARTPSGRLAGYFALSDGSVYAIDLPGGNRIDAGVLWRANVGGYLNHRPLLTKQGIFASGESAGVALIDEESGDIVWRTDLTADFILAVNQENAYVLDQQGNLLVYPLKLPARATSDIAKPIGRLDLREFNHPVANERSDRILLGADNGLLICLRDANAKYFKPLKLRLPETPLEPKEPKKDEEKKEEEPKFDF